MAVALFGPRLAGKTTLASPLPAQRPSLYLAIEAREDGLRLSAAALFLRFGIHGSSSTIRRLWAIDLKCRLSAHPERGFHNACLDLTPHRRFAAPGGTNGNHIPHDVQAAGISDIATELAAL